SSSGFLPFSPPRTARLLLPQRAWLLPGIASPLLLGRRLVEPSSNQPGSIRRDLSRLQTLLQSRPLTSPESSQRLLRSSALRSVPQDRLGPFPARSSRDPIAPGKSRPR